MNNRYDTVVIGGGISGLICGCYLAKKGIKVLIVEKNKKPGGYCTSVEIGGYKFDLGVHNLGNLGYDSVLSKIFKDIGVLNDLKVTKREIVTTMVMPDLEIDLYSDHKRTLCNLKEKFPHEASRLDSFFNVLFETSTHTLYGAYKKESYKKVINKYFKNEKIKCFLHVLSGNNAVSPEHLSGFIALMMIRNFIFDSGYNIKKGGVQMLSDNLERKFLSFGGDAMYNTEVDGIEIKNKKTTGIRFKKSIINSKYVISASDAYNTFTSLIDKSCISTNIISKLKRLMPTSSALIFFLGLRPNSLKFSHKKYSFWYCPTYRSNLYFSDSSDIKSKPIFFYSPTQYDKTLAANRGDILTAVIVAKYENELFWDREINDIKSYVIDSAKKIFGISYEDLIVESYKTPYDLFALTKNYKGAMRGWASTPYQCSNNVFPQETMIKNLFCTGHWTTTEFGQGGISNVANTARRAYENILRKESQ